MSNSNLAKAYAKLEDAYADAIQDNKEERQYLSEESLRSLLYNNDIFSDQKAEVMVQRILAITGCRRRAMIESLLRGLWFIRSHGHLAHKGRSGYQLQIDCAEFLERCIFSKPCNIEKDDFPFLALNFKHRIISHFGKISHNIGDKVFADDLCHCAKHITLDRWNIVSTHY